ncbi:MAG: zinc ribbon domain-containing protein [Faecousia sp.]
MVQILLKANARSAPSNKPSHRYAGLLQCGDCGSGFVPMIRYWNGNRRVEYVCRSYHRGGKTICSSHRIHEETLDARVREYLEALHSQWTEEQTELRQIQRQWKMKRPAIHARLTALDEEIQKLEQEIDDILLTKIMQSS